MKNNIIPLSDMTISQSGTVQDITTDSLHGQRLMEMGITPGCPITIVRFAPMGDPIDIQLRGYHLSIRHQDAACIQVIIDSQEIA